MEPSYDLPQARLEHVRVDLRRRQIGVPEHRLDRAQIRAALEQVRREGMPQHVRRQMTADAGLLAVDAQQLPEAGPRQRPRPPVAPWPASR